MRLLFFFKLLLFYETRCINNSPEIDEYLQKLEEQEPVLNQQLKEQEKKAKDAEPDDKEVKRLEKIVASSKKGIVAMLIKVQYEMQLSWRFYIFFYFSCFIFLFFFLILAFLKKND